MDYQVLKGVVYTRVCGQNILVATRPVWGKCPYTRLLSALGGAFWQGITMGLSEDEIVEELQAKTNIKEKALRKQFHAFVETMVNEGYMVKADVV